MAQNDDFELLESDERKRSNTSAITRPNNTYSNDASTGPSPDR